MRSGILRRRSALRVRTVPPMRAFSGMMLKAVPAPISPTVRTAGSTGSTSLETTVCNAVTTCAAMTTASAARCGIAPCPPEPLISIERVGRGHDRTCLRRHRPERQSGPQVQREDGGDAVRHPLLDHDFPSSSAFLRRLEDKPDGTVQPVAHARERVSRADEHAGMRVVAAGVHPALYLRGER